MFKARYYAELSGLPTLADDSGIEVDALGGLPGVRTRRYAGEQATDEDNNVKLLAALRGMPTERRGARYRCVLAFVDPVVPDVSARRAAAPPSGHATVRRGTFEGRIAEGPRGTGGFGYDPIFEPALEPPGDGRWASTPRMRRTGFRTVRRRPGRCGASSCSAGTDVEAIVVIVASFLAATLAAVAGFGGAAVLLPVLVAAFGVRDAIPILTVAQLIGNGSRGSGSTAEELDLGVVGWFAIGGCPARVLGGLLFASGAPRRSDAPARRVSVVDGGVAPSATRAGPRRPPLRSFTLIGAVFSFLSALLGSVGPLMAPFFLAYGLTKGAYIGTEALSTVVMHVTKLVAYGQRVTADTASVAIGLALGPIMIVGSAVRQAGRRPAAGARLRRDHRGRCSSSAGWRSSSAAERVAPKPVDRQVSSPARRRHSLRAFSHDACRALRAACRARPGRPARALPGRHAARIRSCMPPIRAGSRNGRCRTASASPVHLRGARSVSAGRSLPPASAAFPGDREPLARRRQAPRRGTGPRSGLPGPPLRSRPSSRAPPGTDRNRRVSPTFAGRPGFFGWRLSTRVRRTGPEAELDRGSRPSPGSCGGRHTHGPSREELGRPARSATGRLRFSSDSWRSARGSGRARECRRPRTSPSTRSSH